MSVRWHWLKASSAQRQHNRHRYTHTRTHRGSSHRALCSARRVEPSALSRRGAFFEVSRSRSLSHSLALPPPRLLHVCVRVCVCKFNLLNTFCARRRRTRTVCNNLSEMCTHLATAKATLVQWRQATEAISLYLTDTHTRCTLHRYLQSPHTHTQREHTQLQIQIHS